jgi:hypothetical protein
MGMGWAHVGGTFAQLSLTIAPPLPQVHVVRANVWLQASMLCI